MILPYILVRKQQHVLSFLLFTSRSVSLRSLPAKHIKSPLKNNRLILFKEIIAVYCENHTEHTNTLCGRMQNPVRTSQETHYIPATKQPVNAV
jgi:hypothetical protein